jgi:histidine triad (HIT) family protein
MDCLFCKIIAGELPGHKIYEDELFICILDAYPGTVGHSLIMPKRHAADFFALTAQEAAALGTAAQKVAGLLQDRLRPAGLNLLQNNGKAAGQVVMHFHLHLIPRYENDNIRFSHSAPTPSAEQLAQIAKLLE